MLGKWRWGQRKRQGTCLIRDESSCCVLEDRPPVKHWSGVSKSYQEYIWTNDGNGRYYCPLLQPADYTRD